MKTILPTATLLATSLLSACAGTPPAQPQPPTTVAFAPAAAPIAAADQSAHAKLVADARAAGFRAETRGSSFQYCRDDNDTGSHLRKRTCYGEDQIAEVLRIEEQNRKDWAMSRSNCGNASCNGGKAGN